MEHKDGIEIDLLKLAKALLKKAWLIVLVAVIVAGAVFGYGKMTYVPSYSADVTMYVKGAENDIAYTSASAATRIKTVSALLGTQTVLETINDAAGLELDAETLAPMITVKAISSSEMLTVKAKSNDPAEVVLLANTAAEVLKEESEKIHGENTLIVFEPAVEAVQEDSGSNAVSQAVKVAALAAIFLCALIVAKELLFDWKKASPKKA